MTTPARSIGAEHGYTLIELVVSMAIGMIVILAAFSFLDFTSEDVARTTERVHVNQIGRTALERIMLELHSACVAPSVNPVQVKSTGSVLRFISESGSQSALPVVHLREIIYTEKSGSTPGTLVEKSYPSTSEVNGNGEYKFSSTATTTILLKGVRQTEEINKTKVFRPIFQYYRYYQKTDSEPKYGELDETPIAAEKLETAESVENITKVTVSFTLAPEGTERSSFGHDRPVALEDSALFRLAPSSEASGNPNQPCSTQT
jgi:type II secretory pathway pseudopilin PulG